MRFKEALGSFFKDKDYYITMFENKIHLFQYREILKISSDEMIFSFSFFVLKIKGNNLTIIQMDKEEILITGHVSEVHKLDE